jgi:hypothetical protein
VLGARGARFGIESAAYIVAALRNKAKRRIHWRVYR